MIRELYDRYLLPYFIDMAAGVTLLERQRRIIVPRARGRVLEVGFGSGRNLPFYNASRMKEIVGLEPSEPMRQRARKRLERSALPVTLVDAVAEEMPFKSKSFDTVLLTFTLCSVSDPLRALREMRRVLSPGGRLLFCEHGRSPEGSVSRWQGRLTPWWKKVSGGCHLDRDVVELLQVAGFECPVLDRFYASKLRPWTWITRGEAVRKR
ncbi:MAG: class I SAM-dependent methyltransferase [Thermovirgaceae bacterium]